MHDRFSAIDLCGTRFLTLYGRNTSDVFCTASLQILSVEQALNEWLKSQGIDRTLFYSRSQKVYFWDNESRDRFLPGSMPEPTKPKTKLGIAAPLGNVNLLTSKPKSQNASVQQSIVPPTPRLKDSQCVSYFEAAMHDTRWRSALVFSVSEELRQFDLVRDLQEKLVRWSRLPPNNSNLCVLIFHHESLTALREFCGSSDTSFLARLLIEGNDRQRVSCIPNPSASEINNLIQYFRITQGKSVDWIGSQTLPDRLSEQDKPLSDWYKPFESVSVFSVEQSKVSGWIGCPQQEGEESIESLLAELDSQVGLNDIKESIRELIHVEIANQLLKEDGFEDEAGTRHMILLGNPGTGKTTIARLLGRIYKAAGLLRKGHFVEVDREKIVKKYVGHTAAEMASWIEQALDGVLFIDEAYALARGGDNDFGKEAIDTLVPAMENHRDRLVVILAGYSDEMQIFIDSNPGIKSRVPDQYQIEFPDYSATELLEIFLRFCTKGKRICPDNIKPALADYFNQMWQERDRNFGNGREVRNTYEQMVRRQKVRMVREKLTGDDRFTFSIEDIPNG